MGLRCLLGHDFGGPETERERQEQGDEVVVTVREMKTCERCGERQIISENKEVTSIRTPDEVGFDEGDDNPTHPTVSPDEAVEADDEELEDLTADEDDGVILGAEEAERQSEEMLPSNAPDGEPASDAPDGEPASDAPDGEPASGGADSEVAPPDEPTAADAAPSADADAAERDAVTDRDDGAEFIDADATADAESGTVDDADREPDDGQVSWPKRENVPATDRPAPADPAPWPETEGDDEGYNAQVDDGENVDLSFNGGLTPSTNGELLDGAEILDAEADADESEADGAAEEFVRAGDSGERVRPTPGVRMEYYCPNCETARPAGESSMRVGDICPACRRGYIAERER